MKKLELNDPETKSADVVSENISVLQAVFPDAFREGKVDFDVLKQLLGGAVDDREEKYGLNWHGKLRARQIALTPSSGTLLPVPEESVDWDTTQNLMIEGDNLEVLKLLQKSYAGRVKLIYIDPPYNTGRDFIYPDDFQTSIKNYLSLTGQTDSLGRRATSNTESSGRFHTDWLNMMYPRLKLARSLLHRDGVIFISIDDGEMSRLRLICDDIFGEENFIANIVWQKKQSPQNDAVNMSDMHDHIVVYAKQARRNRGDTIGWQRHKIGRAETQEARYENKDDDPRGPWTSSDLTVNKTATERPNLYYAITNPHTGESVWPSKTRVWGYEKDATTRLLAENRIYWGPDGSNKPRLKVFRSEVDNGVVPSTWWTREFAGDNQDAKREVRALFDDEEAFDTPKPTSLLERVIEVAIGDGPNAIILDFFAGSGSTGHAVWRYNLKASGGHRYILVQLPEPIDDHAFGAKTIAELTRQRLIRAAKKLSGEYPDQSGDLGFRVFKLAESNLRAWEPELVDLEGTLLANAEHIVPGRTEQDILYELLLKLGLDLCVPIETKQIAAKTVQSIGGGALIACLADGLTKDVVENLSAGIVAWWKELAPAVETRVVFKDSGFADDVAKTNMAAILNQNGILDVRSL